MIPGSRKRPDVTIMMPDGDLHIDVTVVCMTKVDESEPLETAAKAKAAHYAELTNFIPFVLGHTGEMHKDAREVMALISPNPEERRWDVKELMAELLQGNWGMVQAGSQRADLDEDLY